VTTSRLGRVPLVALVLAAAYSVAVLVAAFVAPVYESDSSSSSGATSQGADTLVGVNGPGVAIVMVVPLLVTLAVAAVLSMAPPRRALPIAWTLTGLLAAGNLLAMLSVGVFVLPVTVALFVACAAQGAISSPARTGTASVLPGGASGHTQAGS
jgi:hypothetical protein